MADSLSYSDLIKPDNAINDAITALEHLGAEYDTLTQQVKRAAAEIQNTLKAASTTTAAGKATIEQTVAEANSLYEAYKSLTRQLTEVGKAEEYFKQKLGEVNQGTKLAYEQTKFAADSYKGLSALLKELKNEYYSLNQAERDSASNGRVLAEWILDVEKQLKSINDTIKPGVSALNDMSTSYENLKAQLAKVTQEYKSLEEAARNDPAQGGQLLADIRNYTQQIKEIEAALKAASAEPPADPTSIDGMTEALKKAKAEFYALDEAARLDPAVGGAWADYIKDLEKAINEQKSLIKTKKADKSLQDQLNEAQQRYADIMSSIDYHDPATLATSDALTADTAQLNAYNKAIKEQLRIKQLEVQAAQAADGSYRQQSFTYEALVLKIKTMSTADEESLKIKEELIAQARTLKSALKDQEEALGDYHSSVGNYNAVWDGLRSSVFQVVRELPSLAVSTNTFFLAISNNIPILVDEINAAQQKNKDLAASGEETVPVIEQVVNALFSWQSALVLVLTAFSMYGEEILNWIVSLINGEEAVQSLDDALDELGENMLENIKTYGKSIITTKNLANEWKRLKTTAEQVQWIKDNQDAFRQLDINVRSVTDADNIFVKNTVTVIKALQLRAQAMAAQNLAIERYEKALTAQYERDKISAKTPSFWVRTKASILSTLAPSLGSKKSIINDILQEEINEKEKERNRLEAEAEQFFNIGSNFLDQARDLLDSANIDEYHKQGRQGGKGRDAEDELYKRYLDIQKKYEASITALERDESIKRRKEAIDEAAAKIRALEETYRQNEKILNGQSKKYKKITAEQRTMTEQAQQWITETIKNYQEKLSFDLDQIEKDRQLNNLAIARETIDLQLAGIREGSREELALKLELLANRRKAELIENSKLSEKEQQAEADIVLKYDQQIDKLKREQRIKQLNADKSNYDMQLSMARENSADRLAIELAQLNAEEQIALEQNKLLAANLRISEDLIKASFMRRRNILKGSYSMSGFDEQQELEAAKFNTVKHSETAMTKFTLTQERDRWVEQIKLAKAGALDWSDAQLEMAEATVEKLNRELSEAGNFVGRLGKNGLGYTLLESFGFDDDQIAALVEATDIIIEQFKKILNAEVELAEKSVELAEQRVEAAQSAVDAEIEARNNGYANNVATAKKELILEKKNKQEQLKILEAAQRRQEAIDSAMQASSLVTASANLWSSLSSIPIVGKVLAIAAIATMWASFAAAKVKAAQVTASTETYGEGGLEFLEGGSHASGNDIDLHTRNRRNKNMRAEGGEALAIINKKQTRKYRKSLPDIIDSLNRGTFEDKYLNAFASADRLNLAISSAGVVDLSKIETEVTSIRKQNETKYCILPNGDTMIVTGNVKRIIKH